MGIKRIILLLEIIAVFLCFNISAWAGLSESFLINADFSGGYSKLQGKDKSLGINLRLNISLPFEFDKKNFLLPFYEVSYEETDRVKTEEGIVWTYRLLDQIICIGYTCIFNDKIENKFSLQYFNEYVKGTKDENLTSGLYNYYDWGIKEQIKYKGYLSRFPTTFEVGYKFYHRQYPHYEGLYYKVYKKGPRWIENYNGHKIWLEGSMYHGEKKYFYKYTHLWKLYTDDLVQIEPKSGIEYPFSDEKREEKINWLEIGFCNNLSNWLMVKLIGEMSKRRSNQNHYDTKTLTFYPHFFDYNEYKISPSLVFCLYETIDCHLNYSYIYKKYKKRLAQDEKGNYLEEKLDKQDYILGLITYYPLSKRCGLKVKFYYDISKSNTAYEQTYKYNYQSINLSLGIKYEL